MTFSVGENVGPYRITERLGQGGMATVFRAYHANLDRYVALKVLHAALKEDPNFITRFRREAQIVARLEHPHIIPIYDYNEHNGEPYLVMKFIEGETLKGLLARRTLTLDETLHIMLAVGGALTYAHERDVLHRDIKPSNILIDKTGEPFLADFGLARMASAGESTLSQDMMLGTPQYISPEQAQGMRDLTPSTDIYSLGVVLYELVVGRVPFSADTPFAIVHNHIFSPLPLPSKVNPQVPSPVERVLLKTLAKDPADRYLTARQMVEAFRDAVKESGMTQLSAGMYRVPAPSIPETKTAPPPTLALDSSETPAFAAGVGATTPTPTPTPIPAPGSSATPTNANAVTGPITLAQRYARQQRRASLWMLGGFGTLIFTCLIGIYVAVTAFSDANIRAGLGATPRATRTPGGRQVSPTPQGAGTPLQATAATLVAAASTPTPAATDAATPASGGTLRPLSTPADILMQRLLTISLDEANQYIAEHPDDPAGYLALSVAYGRLRKPGDASPPFEKEALAALEKGIRLAQPTPEVLLLFARQAEVAARRLPGANPDAMNTIALLYGYALAFSVEGPGAANRMSVRDSAGKALYDYARDAQRARPEVLDGVFKATQSVAVQAMLALAQFAADRKNDAKQTAVAAFTSNPNLPEVRLISGILREKIDKDSAAAQREYDAVLAMPDAPDWVRDEAQKLKTKGS